MALYYGLRLVKAIETETVALSNADGRLLGEIIYASAPHPLFNNSAMDGCAIRLYELIGEYPWALPVTGELQRGMRARIPALPRRIANQVRAIISRSLYLDCGPLRPGFLRVRKRGRRSAN